PSPESPAKRMVTRSSTWTGLVIVDSLDSKRTGHLHPVAASSRPGAQRPTTPRVGGRQPALPAYNDPFGKPVEAGPEWHDRPAPVTMPGALLPIQAEVSPVTDQPADDAVASARLLVAYVSEDEELQHARDAATETAAPRWA